MSFARFLRDRKASVAPLLALTAIPLFGFVGAAVDYSNASSVRVSMQAALDSTALMLSKTAGSINPTQLQSSAQNLFSANFNRPEVTAPPQVTATYAKQSNGSAVTVSATAQVQTKILGRLGFPQLTIGSTASVNWSNTRLRVALVLDNTGSMAQSGKMAALQTAAHNLLTQLQNAAQVDGDVYVSIIPFGKDVNVGPANYTSSWIDWTDWDIANGTCSKSYSSKNSCLSHGGIWTPKDHSTWNGCVTDRDQNYDTLNTSPLSGGTLFPAEQYASCNTAMMTLSYDWTALNAKIDMMSPAGNTNQAIGLAWGWQSLSQSAPLNAPPLDPNYQYQQVIILLSDGLNTQDRWYSSASPIDTRQQIACSNAKAAGITIYTVLVMSGDSTVLQNCATDASRYFALTNANQIITTFDAIGTSLARLHITH